MKTLTKTKLPNQTGSQRKFQGLCVCQICTCGKHSCCPENKKHVPFNGQTTYHHDYKPCTGIINELKKPCTNHYHERHYDPNLLKTSYDQQYKPHPIENQNVGPSKYDYRPRTGKFYGQTQYNKSFVPKQVNVQRPKDCCHVYTPKRGRFEGTTTYNAQFSPKKVENPTPPTNYKYEKRKVPFQGKTTYNAQFKPHPLQATWKNNGCCDKCRNGCQCAYTPKRVGRFQGQSDYKASYKPYQVQRQQHCPILDLPAYPRNCSPGQCHTHYSAQKNKWQ